MTNFFTTLKSEVGAPDAMFTDDLNTTNTVYGISADISDEKLNAMFKLIDYLVSDDGSKLVFYGLKDVHWKYDDNGNIVMTDRAKEANYISTYQLFSRKEAEYLNVKFPKPRKYSTPPCPPTVSRCTTPWCVSRKKCSCPTWKAMRSRSCSTSSMAIVS